MDITIRLRNKLNGQVEEVALPTSLEAVKERFKLDETDDYDNLVIVDSNVDFIDEYDLLEDVLKFSELVEDVDEHLIYDVYTDRELGEYWVNELGIQNIPRDQLEMYFDYEAYGRDINIESSGGFVADGFLDVH